MTEQAPELPPSTLPKNLQLSMRGFDPASDVFKGLVDALPPLLLELGRYLDLERLDGVTIGYDFDEALASVDLGYESTRAVTYTRNEQVVCVAKVMNVLREGRVMSHVVYNANFIEPILHPESESHLQALHLTAHELGHVAELKWRDRAIPGVMLQPYQTDWLGAMILEASIAVWEEYAACRLTAPFSDREEQKRTYAGTYSNSAAVGVGEAKERVKQYRVHGDLSTLLVETGQPLALPLKLAGYFLGHLDGLEDETDIDVLCSGHVGTVYESILPRLHGELRSLWNEKESWANIDVFDGIVKLMLEVFSAAGMNIQKLEEGHYVDVPFTADTLPGGELDMQLIRLEQTLRGAQ